MGLFKNIGKTLHCNAQKEKVVALIYECNDLIKESEIYRLYHPDADIKSHSAIIKQHSKEEFSFVIDELEKIGKDIRFNIHNYDSMTEAMDLINKEISSIEHDLNNAKTMEMLKQEDFLEDRLINSKVTSEEENAEELENEDFELNF